jgi:hypothetical protein
MQTTAVNEQMKPILPCCNNKEVIVTPVYRLYVVFRRQTMGYRWEVFAWHQGQPGSRSLSRSIQGPDV